MRNIYTWNDELAQLVVTQTDSKTLTDVQRVTDAMKPAAVIDKFIELYLCSMDSNNSIADNWYEQHLLVETLDPDEDRQPIFDDENNQVGEQPNQYETALTARTSLETEHEWLKGYCGLVAPERPVFIADVEQFKADNKALFDVYSKAQGVEISGVQISLTEENQNGIAAVLTGLNLAAELGADMFPMNFKANTPTGTTLISFADLVTFKGFAAQFMAARQAFFV